MKTKHVQAGLGGISKISRARRRPAKLLLCLSLALLIVALAQPRWGTIDRTVFKRSREVIIAMDLSKSMLAEDIKPNRLERAKLVVSSMLNDLQGESVGLVVFAGTAFLQSPMSPDYQILRGFLQEISPDYIPQGGTNYGEMIEAALDSFKQSDGQADRFLIVISDGESLDDSWTEYVDELKKENVKALCLGFGTQAGSLIPDGEGGFHKGPDGAVVLTKLESESLKQLAQATNGIYKEAAVWVDLKELIEETIKSGKAGLAGETRESFQVERYHYFLAPSILLMLFALYREFPSLPKPRTIKPKHA
ncbi:MAG: VWA domain-containing protein [Verrucomicrobiota bacterium]